MLYVGDITNRLQSFGYRPTTNDNSALLHCYEKVTSTIRNNVNCVEIPEDLEKIALDMMVGEFLLAKKTFAPGDLSNLDLDYAVKQIQTGDTNTVFAVDGITPEQKLITFINYLLSYGKSEFSAFRSIKW